MSKKIKKLDLSNVKVKKNSIEVTIDKINVVFKIFFILSFFIGFTTILLLISSIMLYIKLSTKNY
jgi:hypothetical protein